MSEHKITPTPIPMKSLPVGWEWAPNLPPPPIGWKWELYSDAKPTGHGTTIVTYTAHLEPIIEFGLSDPTHPTPKA